MQPLRSRPPWLNTSVEHVEVPCPYSSAIAVLAKQARGEHYAAVVTRTSGPTHHQINSDRGLSAP